MTLETFFEKFDLFADAPDAVAKMRELVLQLAIQGRLESQTDEASFPQVRLDSLGAWAQGCGFPLVEQGHADRPILFSKVSDMNLPGNEREILKTNHTIDEATAKRLRIKVHPLGTVIFPKIGGAIATNKRRVLVRPTAIDNNCSGIIPNKSCSTHWLFLVLSAIDLAKYQSGTSVPAVNQGALGEIEVSLPPLAEQKRIVAKVDELMAVCDRLEAQQQEREQKHAALARASLARFADAPTPANLNLLFHSSFSIPPSDIRKSILTLAVQGKLVPQDPNDEPAEVLLEHINRERLESVKERRFSPMKLLSPVEEGEIAYDVRPGRVVSRLIELVMGIQTGPFGSSLHQSDYQVGGTPVINPASLKDGKIVPIESMAIGLDTLRRLEVFRLKEGDIVMARRGEMGRCAIVTKAEDGWVCGTGSLVLRMPTGLHAPFLALVIGAPEAREYLGGASVGTTMQNLNQGILAKMPVGVPPLAEQRRIVAKVDELMSLVDALEAQLATARTTATNLLAAAIAELTNGKESHILVEV